MVDVILRNYLNNNLTKSDLVNSWGSAILAKIEDRVPTFMGL